MAFCCQSVQDIDSRHTADDLCRIGTVAVILKMSKMEDEKAQLLIQGLNRFKVVEYLEKQGLYACGHLRSQEPQ